MSSTMKVGFAAACLFVSSAAAAQTASTSPSTEGYTFRPDMGTMMDSAPAIEKEEDALIPRRKRMVTMLRAGAYAGTGDSATACEGPSCPDAEGGTPYGESGFDLQWSLLGNVGRNFRFGGGMGVVPRVAITEGGEDFELGTELHFDIVGEGVVDLSQRLALTIRGTAGAAMLLPSGELEDIASATRAQCSAMEQEGRVDDCDVNPGPYGGARLALGAGVLYDLGGIGLRAELEMQLYVYRTVVTAMDDDELSLVFVGHRPMALVGFEL